MNAKDRWTFRAWVEAVVRHSLLRTADGEGVGTVTVAALQTVLLWLALAGFAVSVPLAMWEKIAGIWPSATGALAFLMALVVTPYQLWKEEAERADLAEEAIVPAPRIEGRVIKRSTRTKVLLLITNDLGGSLQRCHVSVTRVAIGNGIHDPIDMNVQPFRLPWDGRFGEGHDTDIHDFAEIEVCHRFRDRQHGGLVYQWGKHGHECQHSVAAPYTWIEMSVAAAGSMRQTGTLVVHMHDSQEPDSDMTAEWVPKGSSDVISKLSASRIEALSHGESE